MLPIAEVYATFAQDLPRARLVEVARELVPFGEEAIGFQLHERLGDVRFRVEATVEAGSTSVQLKIFAAANIIFVYISLYGDFRSGVDAMVKDSRAASRFVLKHLPKVLGTPEHPVSQHIEVRVPKQLKDVLERIYGPDASR